MEVSFQGLQAVLRKGQAYVYGHHVTSDGETVVTLPIDSSFKLVLRIDLTKPAGHEGTLEAVSVLEQENLLNDGMIFDIPLYEVTTGPTSVTTKKDLRLLDERKLVYFKEMEL